MIDTVAVCGKVIDKIKALDFKYEVNSFPSGAFMIDIRIKDSMLVVQISEKLIGISIIDSDFVEFSSQSDISFNEYSEFEKEFERRIQSLS